MDEPFGALDAKIREELRRTIRQIQRELGIATILVTHDQEEAFALADRIGVMHQGRLLECGRAGRSLHAAGARASSRPSSAPRTCCSATARRKACASRRPARREPPPREVVAVLRPEEVELAAGPTARAVELRRLRHGAGGAVRRRDRAPARADADGRAGAGDARPRRRRRRLAARGLAHASRSSARCPLAVGAARGASVRAASTCCRRRFRASRCVAATSSRRPQRCATSPLLVDARRRACRRASPRASTAATAPRPACRCVAAGPGSARDRRVAPRARRRAAARACRRRPAADARRHRCRTPRRGDGDARRWRRACCATFRPSRCYLAIHQPATPERERASQPARPARRALRRAARHGLDMRTEAALRRPGRRAAARTRRTSRTMLVLGARRARRRRGRAARRAARGRAVQRPVLIVRRRADGTRRLSVAGRVPQAERAARLRADVRLHHVLPERARAAAARGAGVQGARHSAGRSSLEILLDERAVASYRLSFGAALLAAAINAVFGFIVAWSLVRYDFPGRRLVDADDRPAVRAADRGLRHRARDRVLADRLARPEARARRRPGRLHLARRRGRADPDRPAVRRALGAAGAGRGAAGPRGRRRDARRRAPGRSSAASSCRP